MLRATVVYNKVALERIYNGEAVPKLEDILASSRYLESFEVLDGDMVGIACVKADDLEAVRTEAEEFLLIEPQRTVVPL